MDTESRKRLLREQQPFGQVSEYNTMPATMPNMAPHSNANLGGETMRGNNGKTVVESFADKNPSAYRDACRNKDNPFAFVGHKFADGKTNLNLTEGYTNAN